MKQYNRLSALILAVVSVAVACEEEKLTDREMLENRPVTTLDVHYSVDGTAVESLSFTSGATVQEVTVDLNDDNLRWNVESNRDWCVVRPAAHRGPGSFILEIAANEDFDARDEATLTFVAGNYRGFRLKAAQHGTDFLVGQPFFLEGKGTRTFTVQVTTEEGTVWTVEGDSWLTALKGDARTLDGYTVTPLTCTVAENNGPTRYGVLRLSSGEDVTEIAVSQFGTDLDYDADGHIFFGKDAPATLSFRAPQFLIGSMDLPGFATASVTDNPDGTVTVTITLEENLSDCAEEREASVSLALNNASASVVTLPTLRQDYLPAHGLLTGRGLQRFAEAVNTGGDTSDWEQDGVVVMVQDIDMTGIEGWTGIGTTEHPFSGRFDGGGFAVLNLRRATSGLFNVCRGATLRNVSLGKGSGIYVNRTFSGSDCLGGIVNVAENTTITGCGNAGTVEYAGTAEDGGEAFVGGIVGWADAQSRITTCKNTGTTALSSMADDETVANLGGIAGYAAGQVSNCETAGGISQSSGIGSVRIGGILARLEDGAQVSNNSFLGTIELAGSTSRAAIGGLFGEIMSGAWIWDNASDKSISMGRIEIGTFKSDASTLIFAGGMAGLADTGVSLTVRGYDLHTDFVLDNTVNQISAFLCLGGVLGGCDPDEPVQGVTLDGIVNQGAISIRYNSSVRASTRRGLFGGIAGYINGPLTAKDCVNEGTIGPAAGGNTNCASANDFLQMIGGIVSLAEGGDAVLTGCENHAALSNGQYCNRLPGVAYQGHYVSACVAGILGAFDYNTADGGFRLELTNCVNTGAIGGYRGYTAGIVGFARNATLRSCKSQADMLGTNSSHKGGIAGGLSNATVSDCEVKGGIHSAAQGGATASPGGILSIALGPVTLENCGYYGNIDSTGNAGVNGGIVSTATGDTVVKNCRFGGKVQNVNVTDNNVEQMAVGNGLGTLTGITYWNGN